MKYARLVQQWGTDPGLWDTKRSSWDQAELGRLKVPGVREVLRLVEIFASEQDHCAISTVEGHEALFWDNTQECAEMCRYALVNEERRAAMAAAGHQRVMRNGHYNEMIVNSILAHASFN